MDADAIDASVVRDRRDLEPVRGTRYVAFVDPSGGRSDPFTLAIARRDRERDVIVLDLKPLAGIPEAGEFRMTILPLRSSEELARGFRKPEPPPR